MNSEHKANLKAGRDAATARYQQQAISIDENWQIRRADEYNWEIRQKINGNWRFQGYYGTLPAALMAIPAKMLGQDAKNSLAQVLECLKEVKYSIQAALPEAERITTPGK